MPRSTQYITLRSLVAKGMSDTLRMFALNAIEQKKAGVSAKAWLETKMQQYGPQFLEDVLKIYDKS